MLRSVSTCFFCLLLVPVLAGAQTRVLPFVTGDCVVTVRLPAPAAPRTEVEVHINKNPLKRLTVAEGTDSVEVALRAPISAGDAVRARRIIGGTPEDPGPEVLPGTGGDTVRCQAAAGDGGGFSDERDTFDASGYVGAAVDNFAPASVGGYEKSEVGGPLTRAVGGFDFEFRLLGSAVSRRQLWVFGETLHGVRRADINCADQEDKPAVCDRLTSANAGRQLQFVLENATSMEAYTGFRYEFLTLQADGDTPAKLYVTARLGVMLLSGEAKSDDETFKANNAYDTHHVGIGLIMPKGRFAGSQLEVGIGRTELFDHAGANRGWRRLKIDGSLGMQLAGPMYGFVQLYSDFDPVGSAADSVQTFFGLSFELGEFFR
jgi:hypothetical protein